MLVLISHIFPYNENPLSISTPAVSGAVESAVIGAVLCAVGNRFQGAGAGAGAVENCLAGAGAGAVASFCSWCGCGRGCGIKIRTAGVGMDMSTN